MKNDVVKKKECDEKKKKINAFDTTGVVNKLTIENFEVRLKQADLATKAEIVDFVKKTDSEDKLKNLNKKITTNKAKHALVQNELKNTSI